MTQDINFCQRCGHRLVEKAIEHKRRPYCPSCGYIVFLDPKVATAVVLSMDGKLVLVKRGTEPAIGRWSFPAGYVDRGEAVEKAAVREAKEETGLDVRLTGLIGLYSTRKSAVVLAVYAAERIDGNLAPGSDVLDTGLFRLDKLPPLAFAHDRQIVDDWQKLLSQG